MHKFNEEVYYAQGFDSQKLAFIKQKALENPRRRCRVCTHASPDDEMHEMFIVHMRGNYVPPHLHKNSAESTLVLEGEGMMTYYSETGQVQKCFYLNANGHGGLSYIRTPVGQLHSLYIESDQFLFKECILGPFNPANMSSPEWAPDEYDIPGVKQFLENAKQNFEQTREIANGC